MAQIPYFGSGVQFRRQSVVIYSLEILILLLSDYLPYMTIVLFKFN